MDRSGGVVALTLAGVLLASGTAAALNARVLHAETSAAVGTAESFLPADEPPAPSLAPAPVLAEQPEPAAPSASPTSGPPSSQPTPAASSPVRTVAAVRPRSSVPSPAPAPRYRGESRRPSPFSDPPESRDRGDSHGSGDQGQGQQGQQQGGSAAPPARDD